MSTLGFCLLWLAGASLQPFEDPAAVDREMISWAAARVPAGLPEERRLMLLHRALVGAGGLGLETAVHTGTAREAFAERRADCVAFAHLFAGLARRLGIPVYFVLETASREQRRAGGLRILEGHLAVGFGQASRARVIDAGGLRRWRPGHFVRIADPSAAAIFFSNRGIEALLAGAGDRAVFWLERAARKAPELAPIWLNLGVARRRAGDPRGAALAAEEARRLEAGTPRRLSGRRGRV